jgi:Rieske Fe-S protein
VSDAAPSRRAVLGGAVAVAAGIAGFFVAREQWSKATPAAAGANGYGAPASGAAGALLAPLSEVPAGGGVVLAAKGVVLTRGPGDAVHGFSSICTHQGCTLASVSGGTINCPCHGSKFNAQTGAVVNGPAALPLPTVAVVVRAGAVYRG